MVLLVAVLALIVGFFLGLAFAARRPAQHTSALAGTSARDAVEPVRQSLAQFESRLREIEASRIEWHAQLREQVEAVRTSSEALRQETGALATALRKPQQRGTWGELQLRRTAELAGMLQYCDFNLQVTARDDTATVRPDMVVRLAGGRHIVVDAKVPLDAYLDAAAQDDAEQSQSLFQAHAERVRAHIRELSAKKYWQQFSDSPEFVVLFMPGESFLAQAMESSPDLLEFAANRNVVLATPMSLIALLRTASLAWSHERLASDAADIHQLATEFLKRAGTVGEHLSKLGAAINSSVRHFNSAIGSFEDRLLPTVRKLGADEATITGLTQQLDGHTRDISATELRTDVG